jgi:hypothetical protein
MSFHRIPLDVLARLLAVPADAVRVDRGLVPVDVELDVPELSGGRGGKGLGNAPRRHSSLSLDHVNERGHRAVGIHRTEAQAEARRYANARGAGRELDEGGLRGRVAVEGLRLVLGEERRLLRGISPETEEVFQAELVLLPGEDRGLPHAGALVAERPHRVEPHGLVARGVRHDVRLGALGVADAVIHRIEENAGDEPARGDAAARVAGCRHVVVEYAAECSVDEIVVLEHRDGALRNGELLDLRTDLAVDSAPGAEIELLQGDVLHRDSSLSGSLIGEHRCHLDRSTVDSIGAATALARAGRYAASIDQRPPALGGHATSMKQPPPALAQERHAASSIIGCLVYSK